MRYAVLMLLVLGLAVQYAEACGSPPPPVVPEDPIFIMTPDYVPEPHENVAGPGGIDQVPTVASNTDYDGSSDPLAEASAPEPMLDENGDYVYDHDGNLLDVYGNVIVAPQAIVTTGDGGSETLETNSAVDFGNTRLPASAFQALLL